MRGYLITTKSLRNNTKRMIDFYNKQQNEYSLAKRKRKDIKPDLIVSSDTHKISWTVSDAHLRRYLTEYRRAGKIFETFDGVRRL